MHQSARIRGWYVVVEHDGVEVWKQRFDDWKEVKQNVAELFMTKGTIKIIPLIH
jgi:hypothetical protein